MGGEKQWSIIKESSKVGQDQRTLKPASVYAWLLWAELYFWKGDWALGFVSTKF